MALLLGSVAALAFVVLLMLIFFAERLAVYIPFNAEQKLASMYENWAQQQGDDDEAGEQVEAYLQKLGARITALSELPEEMSISFHYEDSNTVNAFATLGGNIVVFRGLLEQMPNENALAMVLAHEVAHVKLRHPIMALGRAVTLGVVLTVFDSAAGSDMAGKVLGNMGLLTVLRFNRDQESDADAQALAALQRLYGHVGGADSVFSTFQALEGETGGVEFFRSHPLNIRRIEDIRDQALQQGWELSGPITALPKAIRDITASPAPE